MREVCYLNPRLRLLLSCVLLINLWEEQLVMDLELLLLGSQHHGLLRLPTCDRCHQLGGCLLRYNGLPLELEVVRTIRWHELLST